jgi:RNA polymerase sigma-70 factor, ECF subfamily
VSTDSTWQHALGTGATPRDEITDNEVMSRLAAGDTEILGVILRRYVRPVTLFAEQFVRDRDDAEDVAEETFLIVMRQCSMFDPARAAFPNWLYGIARRVARRQNTRSRRRLLLWERWRREPHVEASSERVAEARETLGRVARILDELPEMQRQCFELHVVRGLDVAVVAAMYEISESTVRQHVFRARRIIRSQLGSLGEA